MPTFRIAEQAQHCTSWHGPCYEEGNREPRTVTKERSDIRVALRIIQLLGSGEGLGAEAAELGDGVCLGH